MTGWNWVRIAAVLGFLAVGIGAFGAHGLKNRLEALGTTAPFQTGSQYHMYHALALLALGAVHGPHRANLAGTIAGWSFLLGIVLFSGSLYLLAVTGTKWLGAITPFGGILMMVGWVALAACVSMHPRSVEGGGFSPGASQVTPHGTSDNPASRERKVNSAS